MSQGFGDNNHASSHSETHNQAISSAELLKSVLEATLARGQNAISPEELDALRVVAKSSLTSQAPLQEVALLLVRTFVHARFKDRTPGVQGTEPQHPSLEQMCKSIADTLCSDPNSVIRLTQLWKLLQESST